MAESQFFFPEYLTRCALYRITSREPLFAGFAEEGDVAYYGLILQAGDDPFMKRYLILSAKDRLWEYQHGFGVTAADSALVIEGLLETGVDRGYLAKSVDALFAQFYSRGEGAFMTVTGGRAPYWKGVSLETTAHAAYLAARISPEKYADELARCVDYTVKAQEPDGSWRGKWYPSVMIPTYYAVRFMRYMKCEAKGPLRRAADFIAGSQGSDGSWSGSVIETSAALLAMKALDMPSAARERAKAWLLSMEGEGGWAGEPVLYYWFEDEDGKTFYSCHDKGAITTAWATLALGRSPSAG